MNWRSAAGVLFGLALWWLLVMGLGIAIGLSWPEYGRATKVMMEQSSFRLFTPPLLFVNYALFAVAGMATGCVSALMTKSSKPVLVIAALLLAYAGVQHYVLLWDELPSWYNLSIPAVIAGFAWLGGRIVSHRSRASV